MFKRMIKAMLSRTGESIFPTLGGIGGGLTGWFEAYGPTIWSAVIFATVGGILGFLVGKFMQWSWRCIVKKDDL